MQMRLGFLASEMNEDPQQNRQCYRGGETGGKEPAVVCYIQACCDKRNDIHGNEQRDTHHCSNLLWCFFRCIGVFIFGIFRV